MLRGSEVGGGGVQLPGNDLAKFVSNNSQTFTGELSAERSL